MKILVACEFSGVVRDAFAARGHDACSCDLMPSETDGTHVQGDVVRLLEQSWDLIVAHPPCTFLCNSGVRWLSTEPGRYENLAKAAWFFMACLTANSPRIAVENPIPHRYAELPRYNQLIQPWQFGHGETKATCLWLKGLPKLKPTQIVAGRKPVVHLEPPGPERMKNRSRTKPGIAAAMAEQWGNT